MIGSLNRMATSLFKYEFFWSNLYSPHLLLRVLRFCGEFKESFQRVFREFSGSFFNYAQSSRAFLKLNGEFWVSFRTLAETFREFSELMENFESFFAESSREFSELMESFESFLLSHGKKWVPNDLNWPINHDHLICLFVNPTYFCFRLSTLMPDFYS